MSFLQMKGDSSDMAFRWTILGDFDDNNIQWCGNLEKAGRKLGCISNAVPRHQVHLRGDSHDDYAKVPRNLELPHNLHVLMRRRAKHPG